MRSLAGVGKKIAKRALGGATLAADLDVSSIDGRGAPPNAQIRADPEV